MLSEKNLTAEAGRLRLSIIPQSALNLPPRVLTTTLMLFEMCFNA
jgi:hypothetical protein